MKLGLPLMLVAISVVTLGNCMPPIGRDYSHCRCVGLETRMVPPENLKSIEIFPRGPHCQTTEVIAGLARGEKICLDPATHWVKKLTKYVAEQQHRRL